MKPLPQVSVHGKDVDSAGPLPLVHSVKSRLKDPDHLRKKIIRKWSDGPITPETLLSRITDCAGVRVLHLYSQQFRDIHSAIREHIRQGYWHLNEPPVAYSWDPEATAFFTSLHVHAETRDSYYTSIHYVVKPQPATDLACEIQVRTLFEEAWGEIDHALNSATCPIWPPDWHPAPPFRNSRSS